LEGNETKRLVQKLESRIQRVKKCESREHFHLCRCKLADGTSFLIIHSYGAFFGQSAFAQHAVVVENSVVKVPADTDLVMLSPLGCGLQTGAGALFNLLKPAKSSSVSIFGLGAVGMGALFAAKYLGVETIVVVDLVEGKLDLAKELGATHSVNAKDPEIVKKIKEMTQYNSGARYSVECSGNTKALLCAWESLANKGHLVRLASFSAFAIVSH